MLLSLLAFGVDPRVSQGIVVNVDVNVGLLGFSGEGAWQFELNARELHSLLELLLPERRPSCGPEATPMGVTYKLNYNVVLMQTGLARLQHTLATAMRPAHADERGVYDVEASAIEEHFDMLYASYFTPSSSSTLIRATWLSWPTSLRPSATATGTTEARRRRCG